jgi:hypothetical protein
MVFKDYSHQVGDEESSKHHPAEAHQMLHLRTREKLLDAKSGKAVAQSPEDQLPKPAKNATH